jgi:branched-chain amino acid transport system substrate-binding protein
VVLVIVALVLGSCTADDERDVPTARRPAGTPVVVGFINTEGAALGSIPELRVGSEAARKYINAELDGLGGRPIDFEVCITDSSPESSTGCANRMVERAVVAVLGGVDLGIAASLPILTAAGIPYIATTPLLPPDFTTDGAFTLDPGGLAIAASAAFAADELGARRVAILYDDSPQGRQLAEAFVRPVLLRHGVPEDGIVLVTERSDAPDVAPAVATATKGDPDAVIVVFAPPACSRIMQAVAALGVEADMLYIGRCAAPAVVAAGGAGADGAYFFSSILNPAAHPDDDEVSLYVEKVKEYGERGVDADSYDVARGFAVTMTFHRRLQSVGSADLTPAAVATAFRTAVDAPSFMGHPFTCDGRQGAPGFVSLCNSRVRIYQLEGGRHRDASGEWISAGAAIAGSG